MSTYVVTEAVGACHVPTASGEVVLVETGDSIPADAVEADIARLLDAGVITPADVGEPTASTAELDASTGRRGKSRTTEAGDTAASDTTGS